MQTQLNVPSFMKDFFLPGLINFFKFLKEYRTPFIVISTAVLFIVLAKHHPFGKQHISALIYYGIMPLAVSMLFLRKNPFDMGFGLGNYQIWIPLSCVYLLFAIPLVYIGASTQSMSKYYAARNFDFLSYILNTSVYMLGWEFLFRGYMLFGLRDTFKEGSILIQMIPFTILHFGKPEAEVISCIISGTVWGYICYRGNSFWPAVLMHLSVNFSNKLFIVGHF
jgi:membrane protease YdiL (CAAX protease family)